MGFKVFGCKAGDLGFQPKGLRDNLQNFWTGKLQGKAVRQQTVREQKQRRFAKTPTCRCSKDATSLPFHPTDGKESAKTCRNRTPSRTRLQANGRAVELRIFLDIYPWTLLLKKIPALPARKILGMWEVVTLTLHDGEGLVCSVSLQVLLSTPDAELGLEGHACDCWTSQISEISKVEIPSSWKLVAAGQHGGWTPTARDQLPIPPGSASDSLP